jgi:hypothetical protein
MDESRDSTSLESMLTDSSGSGDGDNRPWSILQCDVNGTLDSELYYKYLDRMADEDACRVRVRACIPVTTLYEFQIFDIFKKSAYSVVLHLRRKKKTARQFSRKIDIQISQY